MADFGRTYGFGGPPLPPGESVTSADEVRERVAELAGMMEESRHVVVLTGAGISTQSGIADVSGTRGHVNRAFEKKKPRAMRASGYEHPTTAHMALAGLVGAGKVRAVVTTNMDGLHEKSGIPLSKLLRLRGTSTDLVEEARAHAAAGATVAERETRAALDAWGLRGEDEDATQVSAPGYATKIVVTRELERAERAIEKADLVLVVGASLTAAVQQLPLLLGRGGQIAIVGLQETDMDAEADVVIRGRADVVLLALAAATSTRVPRYMVTKSVTITSTLLVDKAVGKRPGRRHWRVQVANPARGPLYDIDQVLFEPPPGVDGADTVLVDANPFELICDGLIDGGDVIVTLFFACSDGEDFPPYPPVSFVHPLPTCKDVSSSNYTLRFDPTFTQEWSVHQ